MFHTNAISNDPDPLLASVGARFDDLSGEVITRAEQIEILSRPGVDGSGARRLGKRGEPFELTSVVYGPNWAWAKAGQLYYKAMVGQDPFYVIKQSVNWGTYILLGVNIVRTEAVVSVCGNAIGYELYSTLEIRLVARWQLLA